MIHIPESLSPDDIEKISKLITSKLDGHRFGEAIESVLPSIRAEVGEQADAVCSMLEDIERSMDRTDVEVVGASNILDYPEYSDASKARQFLAEIETGNYLQQVLKDSSDVEMSVRIGTENSNPDMQDCSVVTVTYKAGGKNIGSMGVVGPTRMDYGKVMAILKYMSSSLSDILNRLLK